MRGLGLLAGVLCAGLASAQALDAMVAKVDQGVVTWSEVIQERELRRLDGVSAGTLTPEAVTESLVRRRLLVGEAEKLRLPVEEPAKEEKIRPYLDGERGSVLLSLQRLGVNRRALERRARELVLMDQYLGLRREMTFVPEAEVRKLYVSQAQGVGAGSLAEERDQLRARLAEQAFQEELSQWIEQQVEDGRVVRNPLPER